MSHWGGAQWLVIFVMCVRAFLGLCVAIGSLTIREPTNRHGKFGKYVGNRFSDVVLVAILIWGGFWA